MNIERFLVDKMNLPSLSMARRLVIQSDVMVNGKKANLGEEIEEEDSIKVVTKNGKVLLEDEL